MNFILKNPTTSFKGKVRNIIITYLITFIWVQFITRLLYFLYSSSGVKMGQVITVGPELTNEQENWALVTNIFLMCIITPLYEELKYRVLPFFFAKFFSEKLIVPMLLFSSMIIFGEDHRQGYYSLLVQGVFGFFWGCLYIKNNYCYWSVVTVHALWNLSVLLV